MPANYEQINAVLDSPDWTEGEKWVVKWQFGLLGHFARILAEAISRADMDNLSRLALGFPNEVAGYWAWAHGDLGKRLRKAGLPI